MTIEKVVSYVLHTPHNTNKAVLITMLKQLIKDNGGSCPEGPENPDGPGGEGGSGDVIYDGGTET